MVTLTKKIMLVINVQKEFVSRVDETLVFNTKPLPTWTQILQLLAGKYV